MQGFIEHWLPWLFHRLKDSPSVLWVSRIAKLLEFLSGSTIALNIIGVERFRSMLELSATSLKNRNLPPIQRFKLWLQKAASRPYLTSISVALCFVLAGFLTKPLVESASSNVWNDSDSANVKTQIHPQSKRPPALDEGEKPPSLTVEQMADAEKSMAKGLPVSKEMQEAMLESYRAEQNLLKDSEQERKSAADGEDFRASLAAKMPHPEEDKAVDAGTYIMLGGYLVALVAVFALVAFASYLSSLATRVALNLLAKLEVDTERTITKIALVTLIVGFVLDFATS